MKSVHKKAVKHLKGDQKDYKKEIKSLKHEIKEDEELKRSFKKTK